MPDYTGRVQFDEHGKGRIVDLKESDASKGIALQSPARSASPRIWVNGNQVCGDPVPSISTDGWHTFRVNLTSHDN